MCHCQKDTRRRRRLKRAVVRAKNDVDWMIPQTVRRDDSTRRQMHAAERRPAGRDEAAAFWADENETGGSFENEEG